MPALLQSLIGLLLILLMLNRPQGLFGGIRFPRKNA